MSKHGAKMKYVAEWFVCLGLGPTLDAQEKRHRQNNQQHRPIFRSYDRWPYGHPPANSILVLTVKYYIVAYQLVLMRIKTSPLLKRSLRQAKWKWVYNILKWKLQAKWQWCWRTGRINAWKSPWSGPAIQWWFCYHRIHRTKHQRSRLSCRKIMETVSVKTVSLYSKRHRRALCPVGLLFVCQSPQPQISSLWAPHARHKIHG